MDAETVALGAIYHKDLNKMLSECDFVCVVCNYTTETRHIIGEEQFALMKKNCVFCNVSRGGTVDQQALYNCLVEKRIHCAALDVTEPEPLPCDHKLLSPDLKNIIITPHWGTATDKAVLSMTQAALENIKLALADAPKLIAEVKPIIANT